MFPLGRTHHRRCRAKYAEFPPRPGSQSPSLCIDPPQEQIEFTITLKEVGAAKINVIKAIREVTSLGLKEAKDFVDGLPKSVKEGVSKEEAERIAKKLTDAGAVVETT